MNAKHSSRVTLKQDRHRSRTNIQTNIKVRQSYRFLPMKGTVKQDRATYSHWSHKMTQLSTIRLGAWHNRLGKREELGISDNQPMWDHLDQPKLNTRIIQWLTLVMEHYRSVELKGRKSENLQKIGDTIRVILITSKLLLWTAVIMVGQQQLLLHTCLERVAIRDTFWLSETWDKAMLQ